MVQGNLKKMTGKFLRAAVFKGYGCTLYVGIGVPIPILNAQIAKNTGISNSEIFTFVLDYGIPSRERPVLKKVSYEELKSGVIEINGRPVKTSPISSYSMAKSIAELLKREIESGSFFISEAVERLSLKESPNAMMQKKPIITKPTVPTPRRKPVVSAGQYVSRDDIKYAYIAGFVSLYVLRAYSLTIMIGI